MIDPKTSEVVAIEVSLAEIEVVEIEVREEAVCLCDTLF